MTDQELKDLIASRAIQQKETDKILSAKFTEIDKRLDKIDRYFEGIFSKAFKINEDYNISDGDIAEEFFYRTLQKKLQIGENKYDDIGRNWEKSRGKLNEEYDIILTNGKVLEIVEVKHKVHPKDLEKLERKHKNFLKLFPIYKDYEIKGSIAGMTIPKDSIDLAKEKGFSVLIARGDMAVEV